VKDASRWSSRGDDGVVDVLVYVIALALAPLTRPDESARTSTRALARSLSVGGY
jgi:hypothetical protein